MPTPLPKADSPEVKRIADEDPSYLTAYNVCLKDEEELAGSKNKLRHVRILGFLLLHVPNGEARSEVKDCILSRNGDLVEVGEFYERYVILPFKKHRGRTPKLSEHPSQPSFGAEKDEMRVDITQAPTTHNGAKKRALIRDNYRCVVTGIVHRGSIEDKGGVASSTECAHIVPRSTLSGVEPKSEDNLKLDYSASILAVLKRFGYDVEKFNGPKMHSLTNVMTMSLDVHGAFDQLELYFEAISHENHYEVKWYGSQPHPSIRQFITFSTSDPERLPVPAPNLLALHATCCKVGATEYIDEIYRDADELNVLSTDGASGEVLGYLLSLISNPAKLVGATVGQPTLRVGI